MIDNLISRLRKVKRTGNGQFIACCPAHDDRSPSLSIREVEDGRVLVNCLAGCATEDVLSAVGLDFKDISPEKPIFHKAKPIKPRVYSTDALRIIQQESRIVIFAAYELRKNRPMNDDDLARLELAMERINTAVEMANV
jgi:hypothetical protein